MYEVYNIYFTIFSGFLALKTTEYAKTLLAPMQIFRATSAGLQFLQLQSSQKARIGFLRLLPQTLWNFYFPENHY
jgi:hypothetical protein